MIVLDTSAAYALLDARDRYHATAVEIVRSRAGGLVVPAATLGEMGYLLSSRSGPDAVAGFVEDIAHGRFVLDCGDDDIVRTRDLVRRYADLPLSLVDAAVIACAERNRYPVVAFDEDFHVVGREGTITVLPAP